MTSQLQSDDDLLAAARAGDRSAVEALLSRHQQRVYRYGLRLCGDRSDAEDVAQDTLLAMAKSVSGFEGRSSLSTWLYSVARSFCIKKRRKSKFAPAELQSIETSAESTSVDVAASLAPDQVLSAKQLQTALESAIHTLELEQREVLVLRDIEGLSAKQVAEVLEISVAAVKSRLHRARIRLRDLMRPWLPTGASGRPDPRCPDILSLYSRHLEGEVEASVCRAMAEHIATCKRCFADCESLKQTLAICGAASKAEVPQQVQESVRKALRDFLGQSERARK